MFKFIKKLSLAYKLAVLLILPLMIAAFLSLHFLWHQVHMHDEMRLTRKFSILTLVVSETIHNVQLERGMTTAFLSSQGQLFNSERLTSILEVDRSITRLKRDISQLKTAGDPRTERFRDVLQTLHYLKSIRTRVKNRTISSQQAFQFYTHLVMIMVKKAFDVSRHINHENVSKLVLAHVFLINLKENLAQERGLITQILTSNTFPSSIYQDWQALRIRQREYFTLFSNILAKEHQSIHHSVAESFQWTPLQKLRKIVEQRYQQQPTPPSLAVKTWFKTATVPLNKLATTERQMRSSVIQGVEKRRRSMQSAIITLTTALIGTLIFLIAVSITIINSVKEPVSIATNHLKNISDGNFNIDVQTGYGRELDSVLSGIRELAISLQDAQAQATHASKLASLGELSAGVVHEINNPLTIISANNELLKKKLNKMEDNTTLIKRTTMIASAIRSIAAIVNGLRTYSRTDTEQQTCLNSHTLVEETIAMIKDIYKHRQISFTCNFNAKHACFHGNQGRFQQVLMNLFGNARDAIPTNKEGIITITTCNIETSLIIKISDNGCGMSKEIMSQIFKSFFTTKPAGVGTGLGMSLSNSLIHAMRGTISVESTEGVGTTFTLDLPCDESCQQTA